MSHRYRLVAALAVALVSTGCPVEDPVPPLFNALDRSISCPAGEVGWDFSTGGFEDEVKSGVLSNQLRIVEATYGGQCSQVAPGNWTTRFASSCNGNVTCSRLVLEPTDPDPAPGCGKDFTVKYSCGVEETVYTVKYPAEAASNRVNLKCGEPITISRASYGQNVNGALAGNLTARVASLCTGGRRCILPPANSFFGSDPVPGRAKELWLSYFCGNVPGEQGKTFAENAPVDFECSIREAAPKFTISVNEATWGRGCSNARVGNSTAVVRSRCNGKAECQVNVSDTFSGDPAPGCSKKFDVEYTCGTGLVNQVHLSAEAGGKAVTLSCGDTIKLVSASYGAQGSTSTNGNFTTRAQQKCDGRNVCQFELNTGNQLFGSDPSPGQSKRYAFTYLCGSDSAARTANFTESELIRFQCPVAHQRPQIATGLRISSATYGFNCAAADQNAIKNNMLGPVTYNCYGRDICDYAFNGLNPDPVPNCFKHLKVEYRCGDDTEVKTATLAAQSGNLRLSCEPDIKVATARFGSTCGGTDNNALGPVKSACQGKRGACSFQVGDLLGDPFPNCSKDFSATYTCGPNPATKTITLPAEASFSTASFSCPAPTTPFVRKACVPERCIGRQRRNADLRCVTDLTKPVLPAIANVNLSGISSATGRFVTEFRENTPTQLTVLLTTQAPLDANRFPVGTEVAGAAVWAYDTFRPNAGGATVDGFRCLLANVGLRVTAGTSNQLIGRTEGTVIPPACFGQVTSWADAARRVGMNEVLFRSQYTLSSSGTTRVSVDPEGKAVFVGRPAGATESTALVPNPVGFFYDAPKLWVDSLSYYRQSEVAGANFTYVPKAFVDSAAIEMYANEATARNSKLVISIAEDFVLPTLEVDFNWSLQGDAPGRNPFSPTSPRLDNAVQTLADRKLGATIEITKKSLYDARSSGWVSRANSMVVGTVQGLKLRGGVPAGKTERILAEFTPQLRQRMLTVGGATGWMGSATEKFTEFKIRVCLDMDGSARDAADDQLPLTATRGGQTYSARFVPGRRCVVANQTLVVERDMTIKPLPLPRTASAAQTGKSVNQGDATVATANDFGGQNSCQKQCTIDADCGSGQSCRRPNGATSGLGLCTGAAASASACTNLSREEMGSGGTGGRSQFSLATEAGSSREADGTAHAQADVNAEILSFDVLDAFGEGEEEQESPFSVGWTKYSISIVPNFDIVERAMKGEALAPKPIKPVAKSYHIPPVEGVEREGLAVGIALEIQLWLGPVPVIASFSASVALGFGLNLEVEVNKESEGQSNSPLYPCFGNNPCVKPNVKVQTFKQANGECSLMGGRLADARTNAAMDAVRTAAVSAMTSTNKSAAWIGAQLGYEYTLPECWQYYRTGNPTQNCLATSKTKAMWVADGASFAEGTGSGSALLQVPAGSPFLGSDRNPFLNLYSRIPALAGATYTQSGSVRSVEANNTFPSVCEFEPARSYDAVKVGVTASVEGSAGFGFEVCVPNSAYGFCLGAGVKLIFAEVALAYSFTNNDVFRLNGTLMRNVQVHTIEGAWKWGFLAGSVTAALKLLFFTLEWEIAKYEGVQMSLEQAAQTVGYDGLSGKFGAPLFKESATFSRSVP